MLTESEVSVRLAAGRIRSEAEAFRILQREIQERGEPGPIRKKFRVPGPLAPLLQTTLTHCGMRTLEFKVRHWHSAIGYFWVDWFVCPVCGSAFADDGPPDECV